MTGESGMRVMVLPLKVGEGGTAVEGESLVAVDFGVKKVIYVVMTEGCWFVGVIVMMVWKLVVCTIGLSGTPGRGESGTPG